MWHRWPNDEVAMIQHGRQLVKLQLSGNDDESAYLHCQRVADRYAQLRGSLQPEKALLNQLRLEKTSNSEKTITQLTALLRHASYLSMCESVWQERLLQYCVLTIYPNCVVCKGKRYEVQSKSEVVGMWDEH